MYTPLLQGAIIWHRNIDFASTILVLMTKADAKLDSAGEGEYTHLSCDVTGEEDTMNTHHFEDTNEVDKDNDDDDDDGEDEDNDDDNEAESSHDIEEIEDGMIENDLFVQEL